MKISGKGEFGLIDRFHRMLPEEFSDLILGIGDDAAVYRSRPGWLSLITTDAMVEGVHFDLSYTPLDSLGWKILAINLSDIAAMGGIPKQAVISLAIPETWTVEQIDALYGGLQECSKTFQCSLAGGDTVRSPGPAFLSMTVVGEVEETCLTKRSGAQAGDLICVTGELGGSRTGLEILSQNQKNKFSKSCCRFLKPLPHLKISRELVGSNRVTSMIDISDGLASEINHLCLQSGLGCLVQADLIPVNNEAFQWSEELQIDPILFTLESGEEYELLFTINKKNLDMCHKISEDFKIKISFIGEMTHNKKMRLKLKDNTIPLKHQGWDHFGP